MPIYFDRKQCELDFFCKIPMLRAKDDFGEETWFTPIIRVPMILRVIGTVQMRLL